MDVKILCVLCKSVLSEGELVRLGSKGAQKLQDVSKQRGDDVQRLLLGNEDVQLNKMCYKDYTRPVPAPKATPTPQPKTRRSADGVLDLLLNCLFCGEVLPSEVEVRKHPTRHNVSKASDAAALDALRLLAVSRGDDWGMTVQQRLDMALPGVVTRSARYHKACHVRFQRRGAGPSPLRPLQPTAAGRRPEHDKEFAFEQLCEYLRKSEECQFILSDLSAKMSSLSRSGDVYTDKYLLQKLQGHFTPNEMTVHSKAGAKTVLCFADRSYSEVIDKWRSASRLSKEDEIRKTVEIAATHVREQVRQHHYDLDFYSPAGNLAGCQSEVPDLLKLFVETMVKPSSPTALRKSIAAEHNLISACRPRSFVSPLHLALAVYIHRRFATRELIDVLHSLGVCASYAEVNRYESSVSLHCKPDIAPSAFVQYVYDNADFNIKSLDGHGTFHCIGGIRVVTPASKGPKSCPAPRKLVRTSTDLAELAYISVETYQAGPVRGLLKLKVADLDVNDIKRSFFSVYSLDFLWLSGPLLGVQPRPGWSGFMSLAHRDEKFVTSDIQVLPFVNLSPSDPSTIYSCLLFSSNECRQRGQSHCVVTFDQPLYVKAKEIVASTSSSEWGVVMVIRLGGFHTLMSFMGAAGNIYASSGIEELWQTVYAKNSIAVMLNGHAYARALRAHMLTLLALFTLILIENTDLPLQQVMNLITAYKAALNGKFCDSSYPGVANFQKKVEDLFRIIAVEGRTSKYWVQYMDIVMLMMDLVRAERTGNWELKLKTLKSMLVIFHAAGHLNYAKAVHMYLQDMIELEQKMDVADFHRFTKDGYFTIRRTNKFWAGVFSDMTIEQYLMKLMKSRGGQTHGRGFSATSIAKWIQSMSASIEMISELQSFCGVSTGTSEQHVELRDSRQKRDAQDFDKFLDFLKSHSPFSKPLEMLVSLSSGIVADSTVNCDEAASVGLKALAAMTGKTFGDLHLRRKDKVVTFSSMTKVVKIRGEDEPVSTNQLFHRIACVVREEEQLQKCFEYELAPHPPSLFDDNSLMHKGTKSTLISVLEGISDRSVEAPSRCTHGGYLIHKVVWSNPTSIRDVCRGYVSYLLRHYGRSVIVVFDGYEQSTKDEEHLRRQGLASCPTISVEPGTIVTFPKAKFLNNVENKKNFLQVLRNALHDEKIRTRQARSDADRLIVTTAVEEGKKGNKVVIVGEDTDLLVLLTALADKQTEVHMLIPGKANTKKESVFSSLDLQSKLSRLSDFMLFLHAISGCDSTSALYRKGKKHAFLKLKS